MTVKSILEEKGRNVITLRPDEAISKAIKVLAEKKIGALVVTSESGSIRGILSERDIVRWIAAKGASILDRPLSEAMTTNVKLCNENHTVNELMEIMTKGRFRHLPVEKDGRLDGIISIGDVVKRRIEDIEREADEIRNYIATG